MMDIILEQWKERKQTEQGCMETDRQKCSQTDRNINKKRHTDRDNNEQTRKKINKQTEM